MIVSIIDIEKHFGDNIFKIAGENILYHSIEWNINESYSLLLTRRQADRVYTMSRRSKAPIIGSGEVLTRKAWRIHWARTADDPRVALRLTHAQWARLEAEFVYGGV